MSNVFCVDTMYRPLNPIHPGYARHLLSSGKAAVFRRYPFTIVLKQEVQQSHTQPLRLKLDPGSKTTGLAIVKDTTGEVVFAAEIAHRGQDIVDVLAKRRGVRRMRRQRFTRYRKPRFANRRRPKGWLAPSLESRLTNISTWVSRLMRYCPIGAISQEVVKFDTQAMDNPEISGVEYQQGDLQGYEVREEYLLEKWKRTCAYCGAKDVPLQVEHIHPCAKGGSDRVSNLCLACKKCNIKKGTQDIQDFLQHKPEVLKRILTQAKAPLKDTATVNATHWALYERLNAIGVPIESASGGRTKYNRSKRALPKAHWLDAVCVGASTPEILHVTGVRPLLITATGHGSRQMCLMDKHGFPRTKPKQAKVVKGFQTGDMVKAIVSSGVHIGVHVGRVAVRATGSFNITTSNGGTRQGINARDCRLLHRGDGYSYQKGAAAFPPVV